VKGKEEGADVQITKIEGEEKRMLESSPGLMRLDRRMEGERGNGEGGDTLAWFRGKRRGGGREEGRGERGE
jgi:hypothetical protein